MKTVCLCGSTKFKEEFEKINLEFTTRGYIVYSVASFSHADKREISAEDKLVFDAVHMGKIANSECIFVINKNGYIGESTLREIFFARVMNKQVSFLESDHTSTRLARSTNFRSENRPCPGIGI